MVRLGVRWRIGDGRNVDIWRDKWIPIENCHIPFTPNLRGMTDTSIASLIDHESMCKEYLVNLVFWEEDSLSILQIPLNGLSSCDVQVWSFTNHGFYFVKTTYYLMRRMKSQQISSRHGQCSSSVQGVGVET